jgi:uncharacterized protein YbbC (DUF1343 family)
VSKIRIGLEKLIDDSSLQASIKGNIGYLGHSAAVDQDLHLGLETLIKIFGKRLTKAFGPQHGFVTDVQDNMIETVDQKHPYYHIPVYSLYGETRIPTDEMLAGLDTILVDLQDVGTRVYTYITTLSYLMEACADRDIEIVILDRPNPVGGEIWEGPILEKKWRSFVGHHPIPQRHALTMGEVAQLQQKLFCPQTKLRVIKMDGWQRNYHWQDLGRAWINPSPNLPTPESALTFAGTVLYEGTNISDGRGTTRSLEVLGAPQINPFSFAKQAQAVLDAAGISDVYLRPIQFFPMFQKHAQLPCGGVHIHALRPKTFRSWKTGAILLREFYQNTSFAFAWNDKPYEYQYENLAIDFINGGESLRHWVESKGSLEQLEELEKKDWPEYLNLREDILLYR